MTLTITTRLTLWYLTIFGLIVITLALALYFIFTTTESDTLDRECRTYAEFLIASANPKNLAMEDVYNQLQEATTVADVRFPLQRFFLINRDSAMYENTPDALVDPFLDSLEIDLQATTGAFQTVTVGTIEYRAYIHPIVGRISNALALVVVAPTHRLKARAARLRILLLLAIPISLVAAGLGGWFMARKALAPVAQITSAAAEISATNLHQRVPTPRSNDEIAQLANTFNAMIGRLEETFSSQQQFIADASHDIRTPLTVIQTELELMIGRHHDPETSAALERSIREVERLSRLAGDLLLLARADTQQLTPGKQRERLDEIVVESVRAFQAIALSKGIGLQVLIHDSAEIVADSQLIQRALSNLIGNAVKYSPSQGIVRIELRVGGDHAVVVISDTGAGIAAHDLPRLFDRFYRGDQARTSEGTGLGLAIAQSIIQAHGGTITIASTLGLGTDVTVRLPLADSHHRLGDETKA